MRAILSLSTGKLKPVSAKVFLTLNAAQRAAYFQTFPHSSHRRLRKDGTKKTDAEMEQEEQEAKESKSETKKSEEDSPPQKFPKRQIAFAKAVFDDVGFQLNDITKAIRAPKDDIIEALNNKDFKSLINAAGGTVKGLSKAALGVLKLPNTVLGATFKELHKTKALKKLHKGTMKVDEFLKKYPMIKKMGAPLIAGAMIYQWMNMSFSGDLDDDFDITHIADALKGDYSVESFLGSPNGMKAMAQLALGISTGGLASFPWFSSMNITFAALFTVARKMENTKLAKAAHNALTHNMEKAKA